MQHHESAGLRPAHAPVTRGIRATAAVLIILAAPAISASGALTTALNGTSPAVRFPAGYGVALAATVAATAVAAILAALIARRDALIAIPVSLGIWAITGASVVAAGIQLRHTGLTDWGWILVTASVIGAAVGMPLAARLGRPQRTRRPMTMPEPGQTAPQQQEKTTTSIRQRPAAVTERGR